MKLVLPLHKYDEAGRVKPPWLLYAALIFLARSLMVFVASLSFRQDGGLLLSIFYPVKSHFYLSLVSAIPALLLIFGLGFRDKLWSAGRGAYFAFLPFILAILFATDLAIHVYIIQASAFAFDLVSASTLLLGISFIAYLIRSQHIKNMLKDWRLDH